MTDIVTFHGDDRPHSATRLADRLRADWPIDDGHVAGGGAVNEQPLVARCAECGDTFTPTEWELRHTRGDGEDIHERCCDHCGEAS